MIPYLSGRGRGVVGLWLWRWGNPIFWEHLRPTHVGYMVNSGAEAQPTSLAAALFENLAVPTTYTGGKASPLKALGSKGPGRAICMAFTAFCGSVLCPSHRLTTEPLASTWLGFLSSAPAELYCRTRYMAKLDGDRRIEKQMEQQKGKVDSKGKARKC